MEQVSPLMIVLQSAEDQPFAQQLATAMGYGVADVVLGTPGDAAQMLMGRSTSPKYMVLDIGSMLPADVLQQIDHVAQYCEPGVKVVVIGDVNDIALYRELKNRGIIEYFNKPANIPSVRSALMSALAPINSGARGSQEEGYVVSFMSAASGDGSSTVALNTAYALAHAYKQPTVLIDMDYQFGMIARNLDQNSPFGIKDIFEFPDRIVDTILIEKMLVSHAREPMLKVIAAPNDLRLMPAIKPEVIRNLIHTLKSQFKFVIIDLPHIWSPWVAAALSEADQTVMVAQLWLRSVTHSSRLLKTWRDIGIDPARTLVAINRSGAKFKEAISERDFERVCGMPIHFNLANDTKTIVTAENQGKTVLELGNNLIGNQFKDLAGYLVAQREGKPFEPKATPQKSGLAGLLKRN